jgi:hypothetical protein
MIFVAEEHAIYTSICPVYCGENTRHQPYFTTPDEQVSAENAVRLMDAFVDKLDLQKLGILNRHRALALCLLCY